MSIYTDIAEDPSVFKAIRELQEHLANVKFDRKDIFKGTDKEIEIIRNGLTNLLNAYHNLINELKNLSKKNDIKFKELKEFLKHVNDFQEGFKSFCLSIDDLNLSDKENLKKMSNTKSRLEVSFKQFEEFRNIHNNMVAAVDLPKRIENLEEKFKTLHSSLEPTFRQPIFEMNIKTLETRSKDLMEKTKTAKRTSDNTIRNQEFITGVSITLMLLISPVCSLIMVPFYVFGQYTEIQKNIIYRKRIENIENIQKDITSIQNLLEVSKQDPKKPIKDKKEIAQDILHDLEKGVKDLASMYKVDISERKKHQLK